MIIFFIYSFIEINDDGDDDDDLVAGWISVCDDDISEI